MLKDGEVYKEGSLSDFENSDEELVTAYFKSKNIINSNLT
jgi:ABC-type transporter Mla maintaining outer membrane lipid asymmetry ATPase subunit MlaF